MPSTTNETIAKTLKMLEKFAKDKSAHSLRADIIDTPLMPVLAISDDQFLLLVDFLDTKNAEDNIKRLLEATSHESITLDTSNPLNIFRHELELYFRGDLMEFQTPIKLERADTEFRLSVWRQIKDISFGDTRSYAELAQAILKPNAYRAVANACGRNPLVIVVPCHRVTASNGDLGGFSGGIHKKKWLLAHEKRTLEY